MWFRAQFISWGETCGSEHNVFHGEKHVVQSTMYFMMRNMWFRAQCISCGLTIGLGNSLQLILLLDGVAVAGALGRVDELVGQALGDGLDVAEGGLSGSGTQQPDSLVDTAQRRDVHSLSPHSSRPTNASRVLAGSGVDDGVHKNLEGVLPGEEMDDLKAVVDDTDGHEFLAIVATVHHEGVDQPLHDRTLSLSKSLGCKPSSRVGQISGILLLHGNVILQGHVRDLYIIAAPLAEQFDLRQLSQNLCRQTLVHLCSPVLFHFYLLLKCYREA